ncbi:VgrG-related protein [Streptomyces globosus]|uniref:VgrG-related protein n=1 Tax=Streptomyces TaxID=1883 RepID=UPI000F74149A|nr:VgrG-related protein [Streptomyces sp. WAC05292]RSS82947.1 phage late control D family protein [Streptomyces sp. WAC05292]
MSENTYTTLLHVQLGGAVLPDPLAALLTEGWVDASVNVPSAFQLVFTDGDSSLTQLYPQLAVGSKAVISPFADGVRGTPLITGEVTAVEVDTEPGAGRRLVLRGYDPGHRLLRNRRVAGYPQMTASDIVRRIAAQCGLVLGRVDATPTVYELATQPNITDWDYLARLAAENDVRLSFDPDGRLEFAALRPASGAPADTTPALQSPYVLEWGHNVLQSRVALTSAGQVQRVTVRGWDMLAKRPLAAPAPAGSSADVLADVSAEQLAAPFGRAELDATRTPYTAPSEVAHAARALADDVAGSFAELEVAVTGNPGLLPGRPVAVKGAGFPFEGKYTATGVRHVFASGRPYVTWLTVSGRQFRSLYGLASGGAEGGDGGAGGGAAAALPGVAVALVTNVKDPLGLGRVRLRFPWLSDTYESGWCRVAQFGGTGGGGLLLPDVNDEVLCAFDRGSLEHPYVLAGLYNGVDRATPEPDGIAVVDPTGGKVNWRSLTARSGHTVELLERSGAARSGSGIRLSTGDGALTVRLDEARTELTVTSDGTVTIRGARGVAVESGGDLALSSTGELKLSGGTGLVLESGRGVDVRARVGMDVQTPGRVGIQALGNVGITAATVTLTGVTTRNGVPF